MCETVTFLSKQLYEMCGHVSNIVTTANQSSGVSLFRGSLKTQEILADWFSSKFDGLSHKNSHMYQKNKARWPVRHLSNTRCS